MRHKAIRWALIGILVALAANAFGIDPKTVKGKAAIVCKFEHEILIQRKMDLTANYLTSNFAEHNAWLRTNGIDSFKQAFAKVPPLEGGEESGCPGVKVVVEQGDYVMFMRECTHRGCMNIGPVLPIPVAQFDLYRFEGDKIAEHWDSIEKPQGHEGGMPPKSSD